MLGRPAVSALSRLQCLVSLESGSPSWAGPVLPANYAGLDGSLATTVSLGVDGSWSILVSGSRKEGSEIIREHSLNTPLGKALGDCWELI